MTSMRAVGSTLPSIRTAAELAHQEVLRRELAECHLVGGIWCHGFTVAQLLSIRANLPQTARLVVAKNSDVAAAVAGTRWEAVRPFARGERVAVRAVRRDPTGAPTLPRLLEGVEAAAQQLHRRRFRGPHLRAR
ncbi:hypothetical protein E2562_035281 [Oryza meyeriana var. granulata]|uniref:Uncharacterized protein n=1 Tax=Oryza meyeriana var. granulata TaxID=110450 RepID=A0A6G1F1N2_9ORYZ|nr:hypothetical protein E2562_035281 [Oryza meyeriana var. granulata]